MKRLGVRYVWYYNKKYKTRGHPFQDRFKSECVETDKYLLTVIRYTPESDKSEISEKGRIVAMEQLPWILWIIRFIRMAF